MELFLITVIVFSIFILLLFVGYFISWICNSDKILLFCRMSLRVTLGVLLVIVLGSKLIF